jgi:hypothetical protein
MYAVGKGVDEATSRETTKMITTKTSAMIVY